MSFKVAIPRTIKTQIQSWGLSRTLLLEVYNRLHIDLANRHEEVCFRLAAPTPTFVYTFTLNDEQDPLLFHWLTFWLTCGEQDDTLYIRQAEHVADYDDDDRP